MTQQVGNLPPMPGAFSDDPAPVAGNADGERALTMMRWGAKRLACGAATSNRHQPRFCPIYW
jgi:hypothetical protein